MYLNTLSNENYLHGNDSWTVQAIKLRTIVTDNEASKFLLVLLEIGDFDSEIVWTRETH